MSKPAADVHRHALRLAASRLGGNLRLRDFLDVPCGDLLRWMTGREAIPRDKYLRVVALILDTPGATLRLKKPTDG